MSFDPIRFLDPGDISFERMPHGDLAVQVDGIRHEYVRALRSHPVSAPDRFISLRAPDKADRSKEKEIGILRDLNTLGREAKEIVLEALSRRYMVNVIQRIVALTEEFGYLHWEVQTDIGTHSFTTPRWNQSHVLEMGPEGEGRIVIDIYGNRAFIPNLNQLEERSRRLFLRYIYW
jgi:hypothetical protein